MDSFKKTIENKRVLIIALLSTLLFLLVYTFLYTPFIKEFEIMDNDVHLYYQYTKKLFYEGKIPYIQFPLEYPPLAYLAWLIPAFGYNYENFFLIFELQNAVLTIILGVVLYKIIARIIKPNKALLASFAVTVSLIIFSPVNLVRYDITVALLTLLSIYLFSIYTEKKKVLLAIISWSLLIVGFLAKLYPILLMPILFLYHIKQKDFKNLKKIILTFLTIFALPAILLIFAKPDLSSLINYHKERPLEVESSYASGLILADTLSDKFSVDIVFNHQCFELDGPLSHKLAEVSTWIFLTSAAIVYLTFYINKKQATKRLLVHSMLAVSLFIITNKVFSIQYLIWIIPLLGIVIGLIRSRVKYILMLGLILLPILALYVYPYRFEEFTSGSMVWVRVVNVLKNLLLILLTAFSALFALKK